VQFSFEDLRLSKVIAEYLASNSPSGKVMQKVDMHHVETRQKADRYGKKVDIEIYEIRNK